MENRKVKTKSRGAIGGTISRLSKRRRRTTLRNGIFTTDLRSNLQTNVFTKHWRTRVVTRGPSLNNSFCTENAENCLDHGSQREREGERDSNRKDFRKREHFRNRRARSRWISSSGRFLEIERRARFQ